ncbi:MAG TPA: protein kinase [Gemmatimonadaceae bacterium]|nr:protein kinase [Gemmatimonadaceae bacterium]
MNDLGSASDLQEALGGQYALERELGGGGMSRTYVARDTALDRRVVIKILPPDLAATVSHERFHREILVSASLQHPNIVGILTAGEVKGLPYFTMPFVDGESLRTRMQRHGALSVAQVVSVLRDVARALAYAHERGIVHRDIKPDNVLMTSGAAVVADFGVAKALSSARVRRDREGTNITTAGTSLGTPAYMAPEQAAGDPNTDHRADLYAFGVMAYEMLAGEPPFAGRAPAQLLAAHISEQPRHIAAMRADIPRALAELVMRCLEKDPARRPQSAAEIAIALEDPAMVSGAFASSPTLPVPVRRPPALRLALGLFAATAVVAAAVAIGRGSLRGIATPPAATGPASAADARSIAVLPLISLSADSSDAYLANGITDELTNALSHIASFRVASSTAAKAAQERGVAPEEMGKELNVAYLLEGTVQRQGNRIRIATRLVNAADGFTAWSDVYDRQTTDLFAVQDYVARSVATALSSELGATASTQSTTAALPSTPGTKDSAAYDHYLRGRALFQKRDGASLQAALKEFQTATHIDSSFARAQAGVAQVYAVLPLYGAADPRAAREQGLAAANAALRLDPKSAEGFAARGVLHASAWDFEQASGDLQKAVQIEPNNPLAQQWLGELKLMNGDAKGAVDALVKATKLDPASPIIGSVQAMARQAAGATDSALVLAKRATDFDPTLGGPKLIYGTLLLDAGKPRDAVKVLEQLRVTDPGAPVTLGALGAAYAAAGDRDRAQELLAQLEKKPDAPRAASAIAKVHLALGAKDSALTWLKRAADEHDPAFTSESFLLHFWDPIREDPRFAEVVKRVGLGRVVIVRKGQN